MNTELLLTIASVAVIAISIWAIQYFLARIIYTLFDRWDEERMQKLIDRAKKKHSPTDQNLRSEKNLPYRSKAK